MNIVCRGDSHLKKWLKIDDGVIFLRYICRKGCIINQKGLKFGRKKQYLLGILCMFAVTSFAEVWIEIDEMKVRAAADRVTSFAEVWIEIHHCPFQIRHILVTSFAEVWIEIFCKNTWYSMPVESLPSRKCGLKSIFLLNSSMRACHFLRGSVD